MEAVELERFVRAQDEGGVYATALAELRAGRKRSHWVWFVFPQIAGLGRSSTAWYFALGSVDEARAYLAHPVLGDRLRECAQAMLALRGDRTPEGVLGGIDALKLCSSMTLFQAAAPEEPVFAEVLERYYDGRRDPATLALLG